MAERQSWSLLPPYCPAALDETQEQISGLEAELGDVRQQMAELKTVLYARFGNSINLEE